MERISCMLRSTLTDTGQTTIPAKVRKALKLKPRQRLIYEIHDDGVLLKPETETLADLYGSLKSSVPAASAKVERNTARTKRVNRHS